ncbi:MAG: acyl-CoA thioesterase [Parvularculaceae bacterium]
MFARKRMIRFADVDPAGIVFYPRYFEMINEIVEDWFAEGLDCNWVELTLERRKGAPLAHIEVDFTAPSRLYDELDFSLSVARLGNSSIHLRIRADHAGEARLAARLVIVYIDLDTRRSEPLPADLRRGAERFLVSNAAGAAT